MHHLHTRSGLLLVFVILLAVIAVSQVALKGARVDLTENRVYSLSEGSENLIDKIEEPIQLYFFYSRDAAQGLPPLQAWAQRVEEFLEEVALEGGDKIRLSVVDPEPFSEEEDRAASLGVQPVPLGDGERTLYFGLAGSNSVGETETIPFFQLNRQEQLEYDIAKLLYTLSTPTKPKVGLLSTLPVMGGFDPASRQPRPAWMAFEQLQQFFEIETLENELAAIPGDVELLLLVHPVGLSETTLYAIDQFVLGGGRLLAFVDPYSQVAGPMSMDPTAQGPGPNSALDPLLPAWGLNLSGDLVGDAQAALQVNGPNGRPSYHLGMLGYGAEYLNDEDIITQDVDSVNLGLAGYLTATEGASTTLTPLITSSDQADDLPSYLIQPGMDPARLASAFSPSGERYTLAARLSGPAQSAYGEAAPAGVAAEGEHRSEGEIQVVVVADVDWLANQFWVQVQNFLGQQVASPFAGNGDLLLNAVDNLLGSADVISIKSRAGYARPFTRVEQMKREAGRQFSAKEEELQQRLRETERKLTELQGAEQEGNLLTLSDAQSAELERFLETKLEIRKELRAVRYNLNRDVEQLEGLIKFLNIAGVPLLLVLGALIVSRARQRKEVTIR